MNINDRIQYIVDEIFKGNKSQFAKKIGKSPTSVSNILGDRKSMPSADFLSCIVNSIDCVSPIWLLSDIGTPFIDKNVNENDINAIPVIPEHILYVPLVNQYAYGGYLCGYADAEYIESLPKIPFIVDQEAHGNYIAFEVKGDSMDDGSDESYKEGDRLLCREIRKEYWTESKLHIKKWDFVIVHNEGVLIKRIIDHNIENKTITIHSLNSYYPDKILNLSDVMQIFNVIEMVRPRRR